MSIKIVGIGLSEEDAALRAAPAVTTDIQSITCTTAGKIFVGIQGDDQEQFALKMLFDGQPVEIEQNEKGFNSTIQKTEGRDESYAVDLPMRLVTVQELPHTLQFIIGKYENEVFTESSRSDIFELFTPSEAPVIDPKVSPADSD